MTATIKRGAALLALCLSATAQQQIQPLTVVSAIRDAGVYHIDTGTWTRAGSTAQLGPDVIYSSTAPSGYWASSWSEGATAVDEGTLPGTGHPASGPSDGYIIDGFQFTYCSMDTSVDWSFFFLPSYVPCDLPYTSSNCIDANPTIEIPGAPAAGACWLLTVDLGVSWQCIYADGGECAPGYQGGALGLDHFGLAHFWSTPGGGATGPLLGGYNPSWATPGAGTCYSTAISCAQGNSALGAVDSFALEGAGHAGCYWFGGYQNNNGCAGPVQNPGAQFSMELYTDCTSACWPPPPSCGDVYCTTNPNNTAHIEIDSCSLDGSGNVVTVTNAGLALFSYLCVSAKNGVFTDPPGSSGDLCLIGASIGRYVADLQAPSGTGRYSTDIYNGNTGGGSGLLPMPPGGWLTPGQTWYFQGWHRMPAGVPTQWSRAMECKFH